jgi:signal transduction histidine kinase
MCPQFSYRTPERRRLRSVRSLAARYLDLRRVLRASPNPYLVLKADAPRFTIVDVTESYLRLTGTARAAIIGRGMFEVQPTPGAGARSTQDSELLASLMRALETRAPDAMSIGKFYAHTRGGAVAEQYWARINTPVLDERNEVLRIIHCVEDVTAAVQLAQKTIAAERTAQVKSAFLARMSHELRTPLNAISGYVQLLEQGLPGALTDKQREYLSNIRHSEEHLLALIDELLDLTRAEAGRTEYHMRRVRVVEALAAVQELTAPQLQANNLDYQLITAAPDLAVYADADKLRRIVTNLVTNALKNTDSGGSVRVECDVAGDYVGIHVRDSGRGIDPDQLERIFEPFVQLPGSAPQARGFGLGLSICRELARGMGGDILVESRPGYGSTFTLVLKQYQDESDRIASRAQPQSDNAADD